MRVSILPKTVAIQELMDTSGVRFGTSGVRGLVADLTAEVALAYTLAFLKVVGVKSGRVALAIDLRPSSPTIATACVLAVQQAGLEVDYCGAIPTPALAYYAQKQAIPAIMVTGSHIPFDRNGIKFYRAAGEITKADETEICNATVCWPSVEAVATLPEANPQARKLYVDRYLEFFPKHCLSALTVGVYEHSSVARDVLREILGGLGARVLSLGRTDQFVPIDTEAVGDADVAQAQAWAVEHAFDAIVSTDGDGDRPLLGDAQGNWFRGDVVGILCAQYLRAQAVVTTVSCNTAVECCGSFSLVSRTRIGSPHVIAGIEECLQSGRSSVLGFEPNGGFLVGSPLERDGRVLSPLLTRDAVLPILALLSMARERVCPLSALPATLPPRFTASDRLQGIATETSRALIEALAASNSAVDELVKDLCGRAIGMDQTDGLRITFENGEIVHLRPSGNAPELRCYAESASPDRSIHLVRECLGRLSERSRG